MKTRSKMASILIAALTLLAPTSLLAQRERGATSTAAPVASTESDVTELTDVPFPGHYKLEEGVYWLVQQRESETTTEWVRIADVGGIPLDEYNANRASGVEQSQSLAFLEGLLPDTRVRRAPQTSSSAATWAQSTIYVVLSRRAIRSIEQMRAVPSAVAAWGAKQAPLGIDGELDIGAAASRVGNFDPYRSIADNLVGKLREYFARVEFLEDLSTPVPAGGYLALLDIQYDVDIQKFLKAQTYKKLGDDGYQQVDYGTAGRSYVYLDDQYRVFDRHFGLPKAMRTSRVGPGVVDYRIPTKTSDRMLRNLEIAIALWELEIQTAYAFGAPFKQPRPEVDPAWAGYRAGFER